MKRKAMMFAALFAVVLWGFRKMLLSHAPSVFNSPTEDLSYGWYVPIFSLYVLWTERDELRKSLGKGEWWGVAVLLPFLAFSFFGIRGDQLRFEVIGFAGTLWAMVWAFFGRQAAIRVAFPCAFLLFAMPLTSVLEVVTVRLRLFATSIAYAVLHGFDSDIVRVGTMLSAEDGSFAIDIAAPCSGLRSIFALMAIAAGYAYFNQRNWWCRAILFASSVPLAILGNVMRIISICVVAKGIGGDFATGFYHDYSGYVVFITAVLMLLAVSAFLHRVDGARRDVAPRVAVKGALRGGWWPSIIAALVVTAVMILQSYSPATKLMMLPKVDLGEIAGYASTTVEVSEAERAVLPADTTFFKREYVGEQGDRYLVTVVINGVERRSIHRPELCLPSQGFLIRNRITLPAEGVAWQYLPLSSPRMAKAAMAYTFVNNDGTRTDSHFVRILHDVYSRSMFGRIERWAMITVFANFDDCERLGKFLGKLKGVVK